MGRCSICGIETDGGTCGSCSYTKLHQDIRDDMEANIKRMDYESHREKLRGKKAEWEKDRIDLDLSGLSGSSYLSSSELKSSSSHKSNSTDNELLSVGIPALIFVIVLGLILWFLLHVR